MLRRKKINKTQERLSREKSKMTRHLKWEKQNSQLTHWNKNQLKTDYFMQKLNKIYKRYRMIYKV